MSLPSDWELRRLDDVADVRLGRQRSPKNHAGSQMRPYLRAANVDWSGLRLDDVKEMNFTDDEMAIYRLVPGDIVLSEASGSPDEVGKPAIWLGHIDGCAFQNTLLRVRSRSPEPRYLLHFFSYLAQSGAFARKSRGVGIHHIGRAALAEWPIPTPPISEQRRIVEILEDHLSRLNAGNSDLSNARRRVNLFRAAALGSIWRESDGTGSRRSLDEVGLVITGATPRDRSLGTGAAVIPFVTPGDVKNGEKIRDVARSMFLDSYPTGRVLRQPAVLAVCIGATLGKVGWTDRVVGTNQQINALVVGDNLPDFVAALMASPDFQSQMQDRASATTMPILNKGQFSKLQLPVPTLCQQRILMERLDLMLDSAQRQGEAIATAEMRTKRLRRALLAAAFTGRLTCQKINGGLDEELLGG